MTHACWLRQAESDLTVARNLSDAGHHCQAVWFACQSVEKGMKAILAALGLQYQEKHYKSLGHRIGEILELLPAELQAPHSSEIASMIAQLEARALESRYPSKKGAPTDVFKESTNDINDANALLDWCKERIDRALNAVKAMIPGKPE